ncbi:MAG: putative toxin-antitoxin system toxin component, PIN family [Leptospirales bacterium]
MRVVLDTNVLLSGIAYPASVPGKIVAAWQFGAIDVLLSNYILEELLRVLPRLQHRHGLNNGEINDLVDILAIQAEIVDPQPTNDPSLRDIGDQPILDILVEAVKTFNADYLITGDKDLLALAGRYRIVSPGEFWAAHGGL